MLPIAEYENDVKQPCRELRLRGISNPADGNAYLPEYIADGTSALSTTFTSGEITREESVFDGQNHFAHAQRSIMGPDELYGVFHRPKP